MRVAIIHDWLVTYAGAEKVLEQILSIFPEADLFSIIEFLPQSQRGFILNKEVKTSFIQNLPWAKKKYRSYLPLMPLAIEQFDLAKYDLIISSSHAVAKGVITGPDQLHISYVHSPIRYAWDMQHQYLRQTELTTGVKGWIAKIILHYLRLWDLRTVNSIDCFIANSKFIGRRIWKNYRRQAKVVYPPVDTDFFTMYANKEDYYLTASRMVPYKKIDLVVAAFAKMKDKKLLVIGDGPEYKKIKNQAGENVHLLGYQSIDNLKTYMQKAKAFIFCAEEDFGIMPVEAQACGTPVIAYAKGGILETVDGMDKEVPTGIFFSEQSPSAIIDAVNKFEAEAAQIIKPESCRAKAEKFSQEHFKQEFLEICQKILKEHKKG